VEDDAAALTARIQDCIAESDVLIVSAGTSMGNRDLSQTVLEKLGKIHFHGVALHPARPVLFADVSAVPVIGLPGYPAAAYVASYLYLRPLVLALSKVADNRKQDVFISSEEIPERETDCFYRVHLYDVDGRIYAKRILRGSGSVISLSQMDGLMHVPPGIAIHKRDGVRVDIVNERWRNSFAVQGSQDPNVFRLFDLYHLAMPFHRVLFWNSSVNQALESMMERNAHMAVIAVEDESDPFPEYAAQLQETMHRYRLFTKDSRLHYDLVVLDSHAAQPEIQQLIRLVHSEEYTAFIRSQKDCKKPDPGYADPLLRIDI
jgi:putative molybdopterin biosynthesis protein